MTWATADDVLKLTGKTVTDADVRIAIGLIELRTGVIEEQFPTLWGRDQKFLQAAVCYQAAWISDRPDLFERDDIDSVSQGGDSANLKKWANTLAPFAKLSLRRLSWKGTRSTTIGTRGQTDPQDDDVDRNGRPLAWKPIGR